MDLKIIMNLLLLKYVIINEKENIIRELHYGKKNILRQQCNNIY